MKRMLALTLTLIALFTLPLAARAEGTYAVVSGTSSLNLRYGPGTDYTLLGSANAGAWVEILSADSGWKYVRILSSGLIGYMNANYLKTASASPSGTAYVKNPNPSSFLNLRDAPSYSGNVLGIYYNGTTCQILGESGGWYYVSVNGMLGYFRGEYLSISGGSGVTATVRGANPVNLRSGPGYSYDVITTVSPGASAMVLLKGTNFWQVYVNGLYGFMDSAFLGSSGGGGGGGGGGGTPSSNSYAIVNNPVSTQRLNLREQPTTSSRSIAKYYNGTRVTVLARGTIWCKVRVDASGLTGYMMTQYLTLSGGVSSASRTVRNPSSSYVNLRTKPSKSNAVIVRVPVGASVTLLSPGDQWSYVNYGGTKGYMMTYFLK